jgi:hypothetical protein
VKTWEEMIERDDGTPTIFGWFTLTFLAALVVLLIVVLSWVGRADAAEPSDGATVRFGFQRCLPDGDTMARVVLENGYGTAEWSTALWLGDRYGRETSGTVDLGGADRTVKRIRLHPGQLRYVTVYAGDLVLLSGTLGATRCTR